MNRLAYLSIAAAILIVVGLFFLEDGSNIKFFCMIAGNALALYVLYTRYRSKQ